MNFPDHSDKTKAEKIELFAELRREYSWAECSMILGVSCSTLTRWTNPVSATNDRVRKRRASDPPVPKRRQVDTAETFPVSPIYEYPFDRAADEAAFMERGKREQKERDGRNTQKIHKKLVAARTAREQKLAERFETQRKEARALFAEGMNYSEIALKMGVGKCRAHELVDEEYHQVVKRRKALCEANRRKAA